MSEYFVNTSYVRNYVVVSASSDGVVLRPADNETLMSYWREFLSGYIDVPVPVDVLPTLHISQLPLDVLKVDAYVDYVIEYPRVEVYYGDRVIDISDRVSVNHPNPETPGLYALDFTVSLEGGSSSVIWRSWVSIEEPPLLRKVITPWNRDNKIIADMNRQVIEPQFLEALYEAGVPLYNFQQANAPTAVSQFAVMKYRDARVIVIEGRLFVSGPRLPVGTEVTVAGITRILGVNVLCPQFSPQDVYTAGNLVSYCGTDYYALEDIPVTEYPDPSDPSRVIKGSLLPTSLYFEGGVSNACWLQGTYYSVEAMDLPDGEYELTSLWAALDVGGYTFKMDLLRAFPVHHYWGIYDRKYFYDYATGDLVSVINEGMVSLFQRNDTPITDSAVDSSYKPGHYKNPYWTEVYSESYNDALQNPIIRPCTNASNAIVSKTYPAREEAFRMYAKLVDIPYPLVDAIGAKYSVLLWALLYRTRETFPGIKAALNAIGIDIENLRRVYPSVKYRLWGNSTPIDDIYTEIATVRDIARSVKFDKIWTADGLPPVCGQDDPRYGTAWYVTDWIRYSREGEDPDTVWVCRETSSPRRWEKYYSFEHVGSDRDIADYDYSVNNRYYRADANLMKRLAADCTVDLDDNYQWIDDDSFSSFSLALTKLLSYEVPIYIYLRLRIRLATVGHARVRGISKPVVLKGAWGGSIGLKLYPGKYFDMASLEVRSAYPTVLYSYEKLSEDSPDTDWTEYTGYSPMDGYRYFQFERAVYVRLRFSENNVFKVDSDADTEAGHYRWCWTSRYTIGCLGDPESTDTDDGFIDATQMPTVGSGHSAPDIYLCKGIAAITVRIGTGTVNVSAQALQWQYVFGDPAWTMDEVLPFADWSALDGVKLLGSWVGSAADFKSAVVRCTSPEVPWLTSTWESGTLKVGGGVPRFIYLWDRNSRLIGTLVVPFNERMVLEGNSSDYLLKFVFEDSN